MAFVHPLSGAAVLAAAGAYQCSPLRIRPKTESGSDQFACLFFLVERSMKSHDSV